MLSAGLCAPSRVLCKGMNLGREGEVKLFYSEVLKSSCTFPCCNFRFVSRKLSSVAGNKDVCLENQAGGFCFQNVSCSACLLCLNLIVLTLSWSVRQSPWPVTGVVLLGGGACFTRSECGYWNPSWVFLECRYLGWSNTWCMNAVQEGHVHGGKRDETASLITETPFKADSEHLSLQH